MQASKNTESADWSISPTRASKEEQTCQQQCDALKFAATANSILGVTVSALCPRRHQQRLSYFPEINNKDNGDTTDTGSRHKNNE
ncbi:unnamed protein product [Allacma fusca]|uniref:Uncharacterized protein n=1 Tax=Allacma fusca TaxID=39272 RepID=A0A8J2KEA6_9HEXA|nr:unnamed protein product [Allacma fusca]